MKWTDATFGSDGWYVGDFNGDKREDLMRYVPGVSGGQVFLADGTKFVYSGIWTPAGRGDDDWHIGDFNGDGRMDLMRSIVGVTGADVLISNASGGTTSSGKPLAAQTKGDKGRWLGDVPFAEGSWDGAEEKTFVDAIEKRIAGGEEVSVYQIQKEYEKLKGKACRRVSIIKLLEHHQWDSIYHLKGNDQIQ